jgi:FkbM family methyltransferase
MRVFLDVGAHYGESLEIALDPVWGFERIVCFEPASECARLVRHYRDGRVEVVQAGLGGLSGRGTLYGAGLLGASLYQEKRQLHELDQTSTESVRIIRASDWISSETDVADEVYVKLNCEGSEADILEDLIASGLVAGRLTALLVDFDIEKVPGQEGRREAIWNRLKELRVQAFEPAEFGSNRDDVVRNWLQRTVEPVENIPVRERLTFRLGLYRPGYMWTRQVADHVLPPGIKRRVAERWGKQGRRLSK